MAAEVRIVVTSTGGGSALSDARKDVQALGDAAEKSGGGFGVLKGAAIAGLAAVATATAAAGAGAIKFGMDSLSAGATFESSVLGLKAVAGDSLAQAGFNFDQVSQKALQLGMDTAFSAQESITAMTELVKGGVPIADVMGQATDATLALASAAKMDLGGAAEIVAKQLGVWGETGVTATQVSDLLASAANASSVDVQGLALGLANAGGSAKVAGVGFDELVQTMALIAPNFASAADAGTSLKTFISRLAPSTAPATEAMYALGLATEDGKSKFFDAKGAFIGMQAAAALLKEKTAELSEEQRIQAFNTIFGSDAIRTAAAIANGGAEAFNAMGVSMQAAGGAAAAAATQNQGYNFAVDQLKGSMETLQIVIGTKLLPIFTPLIKLATDALNVVLNFAQGTKDMSGPIDTLSNSLATVSPTLGRWFEIFRDGNGALDSAARIAGELLANFGPFGTVLQDLVNIFLRGQDGITNWIFLGRDLKATFGPEWGGAILSAFQSIHGAIGSISDFLTQKALPAFTSVAQFVQDHLQPIMAGVFAALATAAYTVLLPAFTAWAAAAWATAAANLAALAPIVVPIALIGAAVALLVEAWRRDWGGIQTATLNFWETTGRPIFEQLKTWLANTLTSAISTLAGFWTNTLQPALSAVWSFIQQSVIPLLLDLGGRVFGAVGSAISTLAGFWTNTLWPALQRVWSFLDTYIIPLFAALVDVHLAVLGLAVRTLAGYWTDTLQPALSAAWSFIDTKLKPVLMVLADQALKPVRDAFASLADTWTNNVSPALGPAVSFLRDTLAGAFNALKSAIEKVISFLKTMADLIRNMPGLPTAPTGSSSMGSLSLGMGGGLLAPAGVSGARALLPGSAQGAQAGAGVVNNYNYYYSPTYSEVPKNPSADFALMRTLARVGF